jgi:hypothetical protein
MAWDVEMTELLRVMVNDLDSPQQFSDEKLQKAIVVAAFQVQQEVELPTNYEVSFSDATLEPDPTEGADRNDAFVNLVAQKAACIIDRGGAVAAAQRAISVRDGGSAVDLRGVFQAKLALLEKGWCAVYEATKLEYKAGLASLAGAIVMTPFRLYADGLRRV